MDAATALIEVDSGVKLEQMALSVRQAFNMAVVVDGVGQLREQFMPLTIAGIDDKAGYKAVHAARMKVKNLRVAVEKKRKELKADALAYGKLVDSIAGEITEMIEPIEESLRIKQDAIDMEVERIKAEKLLAERLAREEAERVAREQEAARLREESARREAELAAERARLEAERTAWRAEQERIAAEARAEREALEAKMAEEREAMKAQLAKAEALKMQLESEQRRQQEAAWREQNRIENERKEAARQKAREEAMPEVERIRKFALRVDALRGDLTAMAATFSNPVCIEFVNLANCDLVDVINRMNSFEV